MTVATFDSTSRGMRFASSFSLVRVLRAHLILAALSGLLFGSIDTAHAAPINYGSFVGTMVTYVDVTEDSNSGDPLPLFGAPTVSGNSLDFNPVGFDANASGAGGVDITDGNLQFMVVANPGFAITNFSLNEAGDTTLAGLGTNNTMTAVTADGVLNIHEVDGVGLPAVITVPIALSFVPSGGTFELGTDGGGGPFYHTQWSGSMFVDVTQILTANNVPFNFGATKISINIDNTLTATSEAGTQTLIAKKDFGGVSITVNIPEPSSIALAGFGLLGVLAYRRQGR